MNSEKDMNFDVAIINYGLGNLFSVKNACDFVGLKAIITFDKHEINKSRGIILPGVGSFGDAMLALKRLDLISIIKSCVLEKPLLGICLGMQLLMEQSEEFGKHKGLGIINGVVKKIATARETEKIPQVGWNKIYNDTNLLQWKKSLLNNIDHNSYMYFVHSFIVKPDDKNIIVSKTKYGAMEFCSSFMYKNIFACQFHPEKSGEKGIEIYKNFKKSLSR